MLRAHLLIALNTALWIVVSSSGYGAEQPNVLLLCIDDLRPELQPVSGRHISSRPTLTVWRPPVFLLRVTMSRRPPAARLDTHC